MVKKIILGIIIGIVLIILIALISLPSIVKNYIESNSEELVGRKITIENISVNYFNGGIRIKEFKMFEKDQETMFVGFNELYAKLNLRDLFSGKYTIRKLDLSKPKANIILFENQFNFDDLLTSTDTVESKNNEAEEDVIWEVNNISINKGEIIYHNEMFGSSIEIENLNMKTPGIAYNSDTLMSDIDLKVKSGGTLNVNVFVDLISNKLNAHANLNKLNIEPLIAPLKEFMDIGQLNGELSHDLTFELNLNESTDIALKGDLSLGSVSLFNDKKEKLLAFENFSMVIDTLNVKNDLYNLNTISLEDPYCLFELYDEGDNWSALFHEIDSTSSSQNSEITGASEESYNVFVLLAHYIRDIAKSYTTTKYRFNSFEMTGGFFEYHDFTLHERFNYTVSEMSIRAKNIDADADSVRFDISLLLNEESEGRAEIIIDPADYNNMVVNYDITNTSLAELTPYSIYHVSYPIHKAVLNYSSRTTIDKGIIDSENNITITGFRFGSKTQSHTAINLPVKLAIAILRDVNGNINLEVPVEGDIHDPKFRIGKAVWKILKNLVVKVATSPYKLLANAFGTNEEDLKEFRYDYLETEVGNDQENSVDALAKILQKKEELTIKLIHITDTLREANAFAMLEARKMYYAKIENKGFEDIEFTEEILNEIKTISVKDSSFVYWLDETLLLDNRQIPVQKKCKILIGNKKVQDHALNIRLMREEAITSYFVNEKEIHPSRFTFGTLEDIQNELKEDSSLSPGRPLFIVRFGVD